MHAEQHHDYGNQRLDPENVVAAARRAAAAAEEEEETASRQAGSMMSMAESSSSSTTTTTTTAKKKSDLGDEALSQEQEQVRQEHFKATSTGTSRGGSSNEEQESSTASLDPLELQTIETIEDLRRLFAETSEPTLAKTWITVVYKEDCVVSLELVNRLEQILVESQQNRHYSFGSNVRFAQFPVQVSTRAMLQELRLTRVPALVFLVQQQGHIWAVEYRGAIDTAAALADGIRHYTSRLRLSQLQHKHIDVNVNVNVDVNVNVNVDDASTGSTSDRSTPSTMQYLDALTLRVESVEGLEETLETNQDLFPATMSSAKQRLPLDPLLSEHEQASIRYIMGIEESIGPLPTSRYWTICRCHGASPEVAQEAFDPLASIVGLRHDVAFCIFTTNCPSEDVDTVQMYQVVVPEPLSGVDVSFDLFDTWTPTSSPHNLQQAVMGLLRPTLLWFDRQSTAPMAFAPYHTVHSVLVIDWDELIETVVEGVQRQVRRLVDDFRNLCAAYRRGGDDMVCLVVPSTETRILTTFGIDIWSPLDEQVTQFLQDRQRRRRVDGEAKRQNDIEHRKYVDGKSEGYLENSSTHPHSQQAHGKNSFSASSVLPVLLLTNRTETHGIQRYYLDPPFTTIEMQTFAESFWEGKLDPAVQSRYVKADSEPPPKANAHGVHQWTAHHAMPMTPKARQHTLLMAYTPTCGHCKRLSNIWNTLARLVKHLKWNNWLEIARLDVSTEEFAGVVGISQLPSVYYYHYQEGMEEDARSSSPIWYSEQPSGAVSDPLDFIDWLLDVAPDDLLESSDLLKAIEGLDAETKEEAIEAGDNDDEEAASAKIETT